MCKQPFAACYSMAGRIKFRWFTFAVNDCWNESFCYIFLLGNQCCPPPDPQCHSLKYAKKVIENGHQWYNFNLTFPCFMLSDYSMPLLDFFCLCINPLIPQCTGTTLTIEGYNLHKEIPKFFWAIFHMHKSRANTALMTVLKTSSDLLQSLLFLFPTSLRADFPQTLKIQLRLYDYDIDK